MAKKSGYGVVFKITISTVLTAVAQVKEITFPKQSADVAEVTTHDSTSGYAEWIKTGLFRLEKFTLTLVFDPAAATHIAALAALGSTTAVVMTIQSVSASETVSFSGHIMGFERTSDAKGAYEAKMEIQPTGAPTFS